MADLVTRLKLDDKQFNDNIRKSKRELEQFKAMGNAVASSLKTFAIALIGIETAAQAFNKVIRGSQGISDEYDKVMRAATTTVDNFFASLTTGDFSVFDRGISNIIAKAKAAQAALDQLGNTTMSYNYFNTKNQANFQDALRRAKDKSLSKEERDAAVKEAQAILADQEEITNTYANRTTDAVKKMVAERNNLNPDDFDFSDVEEIFKVDASMNSDIMKADYQATYQEYLNRLKSLNQQYATKTVQDVDQFGNVTYKKVVERTSEYNAKLKELNKTYAKAILNDSLLAKQGDDQVNNIMQLGTSADNAKRNLASMKNSLLEITNQKVDAQNKGTTTVTVKPQFAEGSLGYLEEQIRKKQLEFKYATDITSRNKIQKEIDELTKQKRYIELEYTMSQPLKETKTSLVSMVEMPDFSKMKIENPIKQKDIKINNQFAESLGAIANIMGSVSNMTNEGAAAWLGWAANVMTAVGMAIPQIQTLVAAKTAEGAASAGAEAAKTPLVGWLLVGGAIAAALAAFASIPSFNDGGIFQSPFTTGDKNLARLNGGEMILNKGQQANLFNLLDKGTPLGNGGNVNFRISGKDLVGVISNYNNKRSKVL